MRTNGKILFGVTLAAWVILSSNLQAQDAKTSALSSKLAATDSSAAWTELQAADRLPPTPPEWKMTPPTVEKQHEFYLPYISAAADMAQDFYTRFPKDSNAIAARIQECQKLTLGVRMGGTNLAPRLAAREKDLLGDPQLSEEQRFAIRKEQIVASAMRLEPAGMGAVMAEFEKGVRALQKEFPKNSEVLQLLMEVASNADADKARPILQEIAGSSVASARVKSQANGMLKKFESIGKPLQLQFTAVDGRPVDVSKMAGKVVLVDFWATWCGPCVGELPHVKEAYEKLHGKGFEIVGISLDSDKDRLTKFVADKSMAWPQFFDGQQWKNKYVQEFGINSIPSMWLVDKKGVLRDINGRDGLAGKVEKLLAE